MRTDTYPRLITCMNTHSYTPRRAFVTHVTQRLPCIHAPLHPTCILIYLVGWIFIIETVVLQTVLGDIRAWNTRFLVLLFLLFLTYHLIWLFTSFDCVINVLSFLSILHCFCIFLISHKDGWKYLRYSFIIHFDYNKSGQYHSVFVILKLA